MELTFRSNWFDVSIRTKPTYSPSDDKFLPPQIATRLGDWVWSTSKGWRKLGTA